jgi:hypothetical protein
MIAESLARQQEAAGFSRIPPLLTVPGPAFPFRHRGGGAVTERDSRLAR